MAKGPPNLTQIDKLDDFLNTASILAHHQLDQLHRILPGSQEQNKIIDQESAREHFLIAARCIGLVSLRLARKDNPQFAETLFNPGNTLPILKLLARDFRRNAHILLQKKSESDRSADIWKAARPQYHNPSYIAELAKKYTNYGKALIYRTITHHPFNAEEVIDSALRQQQQLRDDPKYDVLTDFFILTSLTQNPENAMDRIKKEIEQISLDTQVDPENRVNEDTFLESIRASAIKKSKQRKWNTRRKWLSKNF